MTEGETSGQGAKYPETQEERKELLVRELATAIAAEMEKKQKALLEQFAKHLTDLEDRALADEKRWDEVAGIFAKKIEDLDTRLHLLERDFEKDQTRDYKRIKEMREMLDAHLNAGPSSHGEPGRDTPKQQPPESV